MSKTKSVSDIIKNLVIFPTNESPYMSARFEVRNHPVLIKAFGIDCDTIGHIEMGYNDGCGGWFWGPYVPDCDQIAILGCANALAIGMPGWYRIVFRDRITKQPLTGLDDLVVTITETDMPANMLAQFTGGSASMGCGSQVSIREDEDGCFYISVDNQGYKICPGDQVSCDPNGLGIVINGVLCPFPAQTQISAEINEAGCLVIVIDGEAVTLCNSITLVNNLGGGQFQAINPDGSVVTWDGENSVTTVSEFDDGQFRAVNPDGSTVDWNGNDSVTVVSNLGDGQFQAENPDGSIVTWDGENSVTLADANTAEKTITITNPDGSTVTFYYLQEEPEDHEQTQVLKGAGGATNPASHVYTADHKGTYANQVWREAFLRRVGGIAEINIWNPAEEEWDKVAIEAPENLVILNNPVIYVRSASGSANPPIVDQSDLTVENAFNSFDAVRSFMNRTLTVGTVTLDVRGNFLTTMGNFGPGQFKNAQNIVVRGDPANVEAFKFRVGMADGSALGMQGTGGTVTFRDCTAQYVDEAVQPGRASPFQALSGCTIRLGGTVRFEGIFNTERPGSASAHLAYAIGGNIDIASGTTINIALNAAAQLNSGFAPQSQAQLTLGADVILHMQSLADLGDAFIFLASGASMRSVVTGGEPPAVTGTQQPKAAYSVKVNPLAAATFAGYPAPVRAYEFGIDQTGTTTKAEMFVSTVGTLNNSLGTDV